jgi:uncharacterized protein YjbI with pentapeptide repeats
MLPGSLSVRRCLSIFLVVWMSLAFAPLLGGGPASASAAGGAATERLERQKLREEIAKLQRENEPEDFGDAFVRYAPLLTAIVAVVGVIATLWKQLAEREAERRQRHAETERRLEDRFAAILTELGAEKAAAKASATAAIVTYLEPRHERFHHQVRLAVLTNLKLSQEEPIRKLLARVYVESLRTGQEINRFERDLSRAKLANTDLRDLKLAEADLAFADLRDSNLAGCDLFRARGREVTLEGARLCADGGQTPSLIEVRFKGAKCHGADFSGATMVNAHLEESDLTEARFYRCRLQGAHFEGADLTGAKFHQADLADARFAGAILDWECMHGISRARHWRKAHFDPGVKQELEEMAEE